MDRLKSSTEITKLCCIIDLIRLMISEGDNLMKGSVHEDDCYIVQDDLVLLTAKETINLIKQNGYSPIWLPPLNDLQDGTPYAGRPVGNSHNFMTLYNSLNHDILSCYILYVEETNKEERNMCFSYSTPREIYQELKCMWDFQIGVIPSSSRIIQYVDLVLKAL